MRPNNHRQLVTYTKLLASEGKQGRHHQALALFSEMFASPHIHLDPYVLPLVLKSAAALRLPLFMRAIHACAAKSGLLHSPHVASSLVDCFGKCISLADARKLFDDCSQRNVIVWNTMISLYCRSNNLVGALQLFGLMDVQPTESSYNCIIAALSESGGASGPSRAIELCRKMQSAGTKPNLVTILALFPAVIAIGASNFIKEIHGFALRNLIHPNLHFGSGLVEAYAWCGCLSYARNVFEQMEERDVVSWTSMVSAYALHGHAASAMSVFKLMELDSIWPDKIMFLSILKACSHSGLADDALKYFEVMTGVYGLIASSEHYSCLVDLLSRAGRLKEAYEVIKGMPGNATVKAWGALLGACRSYGEVGLAEIAGKELFEIEPDNAGNFVLLAGIYASAGKFEEAERVRRLMEERGVALSGEFSEIQQGHLGGDDWQLTRTATDMVHALVFLGIFTSSLTSIGIRTQADTGVSLKG
ncbi:hypothetical protein ZIOFF_007404 [Zingiber officinale]|uniref:Pentatricopeptide repeat-containing protein n=1 Tax=Zingiber officinale TaxID=94328 RepID=A0A8J5I1U1_ZINOF|nr:hypothetical protein ZIOFF_007404 [Zingiber officinale]